MLIPSLSHESARAVLVLYAQGYSTQEIARCLSGDVAAVRDVIVRAMAAFGAPNGIAFVHEIIRRVLNPTDRAQISRTVLSADITMPGTSMAARILTSFRHPDRSDWTAERHARHFSIPVQRVRDEYQAYASKIQCALGRRLTRAGFVAFVALNPMLPDRQEAIAKCAFMGMSAGACGAALGISHGTVATHLKRLRQRLYLQGRSAGSGVWLDIAQWCYLTHYTEVRRQEWLLSPAGQRANRWYSHLTPRQKEAVGFLCAADVFPPTEAEIALRMAVRSSAIRKYLSQAGMRYRTLWPESSPLTRLHVYLLGVHLLVPIDFPTLS